MNLAVIPARGGSQRIARKNIRDFCGKPIMAYSIETALATGLFDQVIVSTDNEEIASVAREFGAETPFVRPADLADDHTGTNLVIKHAIEWYQERAQTFSLVCCIYATAPFLQGKYLKEGHDKLSNSDKSFAFSVTSFPFPIQRAIRITAENEVEAFWPEHYDSRSQDLEESYHDAGQFYWGRSNAFLDNRKIFSKMSIPILLPRYLVQDIDSLEDWQCAEFMWKAITQRNDD